MGRMDRRLLQLLGVGAALVLALWWSSARLAGQADGETLELTARSLRRAAVQCYALEGVYPTSLAYLEEHYGVAVDESRCFVDYQYVAANLMPDITVLPRS